VALDYILAPDARAFRDNLPPDLQDDLNQIIEGLVADPDPDGVVKVQVPAYFPFRQGTIVARVGPFRIHYRFESPTNRTIIRITNITGRGGVINP
jgi:hypothetical protein